MQVYTAKVPNSLNSKLDYKSGPDEGPAKPNASSLALEWIALTFGLISVSAMLWAARKMQTRPAIILRRVRRSRLRRGGLSCCLLEHLGSR